MTQGDKAKLLLVWCCICLAAAVLGMAAADYTAQFIGG